MLARRFPLPGFSPGDSPADHANRFGSWPVLSGVRTSVGLDRYAVGTSADENVARLRKPSVFERNETRRDELEYDEIGSNAFNY